MRLFLAAVFPIALLLVSGCAEENPTAEDVREHFQRGLSGQGQIGPIDRQDDPYVNQRGADSIPPQP